MCVPPQVALVALSAGSSYLQYKQGKQEAKNAQARQIRQNELAKKNAIQRYASEALKIRQVEKQSSQKGFEATLKARKARAEFVSTAGASGIALSGSTNALLANYYRTEGNFRNAINNNMKMNVSQFERNLEAIQFGQESQSTYETPPNSALLFASSALNVANGYYSRQADLEMRGLKTNKDKQ